MTDEIDKLKKLIGETQNEVAAKGTCFLFHKWSRWTGKPDYQTRYCLNCSKQQEMDKRCKHKWILMNTYEHKKDGVIKQIDSNYTCLLCSKQKRVITPAFGEVTVEYY